MILQKLFKWKFNLLQSTVIAIAATCGTVAGFALIPWYWIIPVFLFLPFLKKRHLISASITFLIFLVISFIHLKITTGHNNTLPSRNSQISGILRCIDRRCSSLPDFPATQIVRCEIYGNGLDFEAPVILPDKRRSAYGDTFAFSGIVIPPQPAGFSCENGNITGEIPPLYSQTPLVAVKTLSPQKSSFSFWKFIFKCRDTLLKQLLSGIRTPSTAIMTAKLFFGISGGIPQELNDNFINTGTIHLFSVSGLHVGLAAGFILLFFAPLPFRIRHYLAAIFTLFYVLLSGASLPALRAGCMIIMWSILRANLFPAPTWNSLMYTWSIFLLISPATAASISAQYSFGITAVMLLLADKTNQIFLPAQQFLGMMNRKSPHIRKERRKLRIRRKIFSVITAPASAFAAGCGISLFRQYNLAAGSIPANLMIIFITPLLFGAMFFKLIAGSLFPWCNQLGAFILEGTFQLLIEITANTASLFSYFNAAAPPLWSVVIYYIFLAIALGAKSRIFNGIGIILTVMTLFFWQHPFFQPPPQFMAINSDSSRPPLMAVLLPEAGSAYLSDVPDRETAVLAGQLLRSKGIHHANIYLSSATDRSSRGLQQLSRQLELNIYTPSDDKSSKAFLRNIRNSDTNINGLPLPESFTVLNKDEAKLRYGNWEFSSQKSGSGRIIEIKTPDGKLLRETLPWCSKPVVRIIELSKQLK